jgi:hypothetical protein
VLNGGQSVQTSVHLCTKQILSIAVGTLTGAAELRVGERGHAIEARDLDEQPVIDSRMNVRKGMDNTSSDFMFNAIRTGTDSPS